MSEKFLCGTINPIQFFFKDDLSFMKDASQSHTHPGNGYGAESAVDGNTTTCTRTYDIGSHGRYSTVWWKVDLGGVYNIYSVNILFKNYIGYGIYYLDCALVEYFTQIVWSYVVKKLNNNIPFHINMLINLERQFIQPLLRFHGRDDQFGIHFK